MHDAASVREHTLAPPSASIPLATPHDPPAPRKLDFLPPSAPKTSMSMLPPPLPYNLGAMPPPGAPSHSTTSLDAFAQAIANRFASPGAPPMLTTRLDSSVFSPRLGLPAFQSMSSNESSPFVPAPPLPGPGSNPTLNLGLTPTPRPRAPAFDSTFPPTPPTALGALLADPASTLILDIRPHAAYRTARVPHAISLSVPSTLLKRPAFSLAKLATMIPHAPSRTRFASWHAGAGASTTTTTIKRVLVYDADTWTLQDGSNVLGLLRKFAAEGFTGEMTWLKGGMQALRREKALHAFIDASEPAAEDDEEEGDEGVAARPMAMDTSTDAGPGASAFLRVRDLPTSAFQSSSTIAVSNRDAPRFARAGPGPSSHPMTLSMPMPTSLAMRLSTALPTSTRSVRPGPHPYTDGTGTRASSTAIAVANPFYDNIRQNIELASGITERIPLRLPPALHARFVRAAHSRAWPAEWGWLREIEGAAGRDEGTEALAMQFYKVELGEQRRMQAVMEHHSREGDAGGWGNGVGSGSGSGNGNRNGHAEAQGNGDAKDAAANGTKKKRRKKAFPYSITAGVEKGTKNRYRNIWPFEHARVRLHAPESDPATSTLPPQSTLRLPAISSMGYGPAPDSGPVMGGGGGMGTGTGMGGRMQLGGTEQEVDDYVNASHVQPLGTNRRYIATQGPLPSTFDDFWTLVWEQNVHVIVMLTLQIENATIKCGRYWEDGSYGAFDLRLIEQVGSPDPEDEKAAARKKTGANGSGSGKGGGADAGVGGGGFDFGFFPAPAPGKIATPREEVQWTLGAPGLPAATAQRLPNIHNNTIRRTFELRRRGVDEPARTITQLQYLAWPDMDVPADPSGVLGLVREVERAVSASERLEALHSQQQWRASPASESGSGSGSSRNGSGGSGTGSGKEKEKRVPVLLHCSAGVGRTGGFMMIDAVLDGLRREMRAARERGDVVTDVLTSSLRAATSPATRNADVAMDMDVDVNLAPGGSGRGVSSGSGTGSRTQTRAKPHVNSMYPPARISPSAVDAGDEHSPGSDGLVSLASSMGMGAHAPSAAVPVPPSPSASAVEREVAKATAKRHAPILAWSQQADEAGAGAPSPRGSIQVGVVRDDSDDAMDVDGDEVRAAAQAAEHKQRQQDKWLKPLSRTGSGRRNDGASAHDGSSDSEQEYPRGARRRVGVTAAGSVSPSTSPKGSSPLRSASSSGSIGVGASLAALMSFTSTSGSSGDALGPRPLPVHLEGVVSPGPPFTLSPSPFARDAPLKSPAPPPYAKTSAASAPAPLIAPTSRKPANAPGNVNPVPLLDAIIKEGSTTTVRSSDSVFSSVFPLTDSQRGYSTAPSSAFDNTDSHTDGIGKPRSSVMPLVNGRNHDETDGSAEVTLDLAQEDSGSPGLREGTSSSDVDYQPPRDINGKESPPMLSTYDEPIRQVLEDMREQRMSLCQSLRQYVFVHRAIIEGALEILVEEGWMEEEDPTDVDKDRDGSESSDSNGGKPPKRRASPTELLKEGKEGEVLLAKRPSLRRKGDASDDSASPPSH